MGERTSYAPGTFSWCDLGTTDTDGAKSFYGDLLGWEPEDMPAGEGVVYTMLKVGGENVSALYEQPQDQRAQGVPPFWLSYVTVEDIDGTADRVAELGGGVLDRPFDVMDVGRMCVVSDPTGAVFALWQPGRSIGATLVNDPGAMCMNQLNTNDTDAARSFYGGLFGWRFESVSEDPPFWSVLNGDTLNGAMMPMPPQAEAGTPPHWLVYFAVEDLDAAREEIAEKGGQVVVEPTEVPAGRFVVATDPQGAYFALFEGEVDP